MKRCSQRVCHLVVGIMVFSLPSLSFPANAEEPTLARLSFWVPPERMGKFEQAYEEQIVPILEKHNLVESSERGRTTVDSVFSRLYTVQTISEMTAKWTSATNDTVFVALLLDLGKRLGAEGAMRSDLRLYSARVGSGKAVLATGVTVGAGVGDRQGQWHTFAVPDGLPASAVQTVHQDQKGYLWFGTGGLWSGQTGGGVTRYDGQHFTIFTMEGGLAGNHVNAIAEDHEGNLWFGTDGGVSRYDGQYFTTFATEDGLAGDSVYVVVVDREGDLWFGTDGGVSRYDGQYFTTFATEDGLADNRVISMLEDREGNLWFGTGAPWSGEAGRGVTRYDLERFSTFTTENGLPGNTITCIMEDRDGDLWFGTEHGITRYDGTWNGVLTMEDGLPGNSIDNITEDHEGFLWIAIRTGGLSRYDGRRFKTHTDAGDFVLCAFEDREQNLWFGSNRGVTRYDGNRFATFTASDGLVDNSVYTLLEDREGGIWFGTEGGVSRFDGEKFATFTTDDGLLSDEVSGLLEDREGNMWFATSGGGISRFDGEKLATFTMDDGLPSDEVSGLLEDREGNMWLSTWGGGISRFDGRQFVVYDENDGLLNNLVWHLLQDREGDLWVGALGGVSRFDGSHFTNYTVADGLGGMYVEHLMQDVRGDLWFATAGGGASSYDGESFTTLTVEDGLPTSEVTSIIQDRKGVLWFATWGGVAQYDGLVVQDLLRRDGLAHSSVYDIMETRSGDIWLATAGGGTRYRTHDAPPPVYVTGVVADSKYCPDEEIRIPSSQPFIIFEFQGLSFKTRPGQMVYLHQLLGYDKEWQQTRGNQVEYTNLPVGEYTFQVKAVDRDLSYSEEAATVKVIVHPPYSQIALWSGLGLSLIGLVIASGYGIKRNRERNRAQQERLELQEQLNKELEEELQTAHDMQMGLMPTESPKIQGFDISGRCLPATHVGGDFFQYFPISDNRLAISLADVTGHAMEAAVPVMMFSGILDTQMETSDSLEKLFARLNRSLHRNLDKRTFVCFTMGELDTDTKRFRLSNGGCPYPYHFKAVSGEIKELQVDGYPLGVRAESSYPVIEAQLESGDRIVLCSDGIIEAENSEEEMFGFERTAETIREGCSQDLSAPQLLDYLIDEVKTFTGDTPQGDDQTIVVLQVES